MAFLPFNKADNSDFTPDFVMVIPEAYVDHPSFGHAIISRLIESEGFSVAIISQPTKDSDYRAFGAPKTAFLVSGGVVDSMVNNYTVAKLRRKTDVYSEYGKAGKRPDRAVTVYTRTLKRLYPEVPVIIGGIEASLRRMAHYDYWADEVMPSVLVSSGADLLMYGMGERAWWDILDLLRKGVPITKIKDVEGTAYLSSYDDLSSAVREKLENKEAIFCPSFEEVARDKRSYVKAHRLQYGNSNYISGKMLVQRNGKDYVVVNPPSRPLTTEEMDRVYALPYERAPHPSYVGPVPAIEEVRFSITDHRGCFGNCSYCALTYHQGRAISARSKESVVKEAELLTKLPDFKGYIHDVGGPTANFRAPSCDRQKESGVCKDRQCIGYKPCPLLKVSHDEYLDILRAIRALPKVKKVFIRSGIRFDYLMMDKNPAFFEELCAHHVSGQLKVAPEHCCDNVLKIMNKPSFGVYEAFKARFDDYNVRHGLKQYLVPYLISSHPGCTVEDAVALTLYLKKIGYMPEQVQDFYPTPATRSTCIFYTGIDPETGEEVYVPKDPEEKKVQRALLQYRKKENADLIRPYLEKYGKERQNRRDGRGKRETKRKLLKK